MSILGRIQRSRAPITSGSRGGTFNPLSLLLGIGGGPVGAILGGVMNAPQFAEAGRKNPRQTASMSLLGSMGQNLTPMSAIGPVPRRTRAPGANQDTRTEEAAPPAPTLPPPPGINETLTTSRAPAPVQRGPQVPGTTAGNAAAVEPTTYGMTPEGQFQRYMQGSEMNRYFGGPASAQAPKDATAMQEAAMLQQAPTTMPLADYYRSQSATGRANMDNIVSSMGYTGNMEQWARANPMLAQRAYAQQFQGGGPATLGNPDAVPVPDAALNPAGPEFRGVGGNGERIYNFAADDMTPEKIKAFQDLLKKQSAQ